MIGWLGQKTIDGYIYLTDLSAQVYLTICELVSPGRQGRWWRNCRACPARAKIAGATC